eukprot:scaffold77486_cov38-Prasinocladus_malaysianus.AAC.1
MTVTLTAMVDWRIICIIDIRIVCTENNASSLCVWPAPSEAPAHKTGRSGSMSAVPDVLRAGGHGIHFS